MIFYIRVSCQQLLPSSKQSSVDDVEVESMICRDKKSQYAPTVTVRSVSSLFQKKCFSPVGRRDGPSHARYSPPWFGILHNCLLDYKPEKKMPIHRYGHKNQTSANSKKGKNKKNITLFRPWSIPHSYTRLFLYQFTTYFKQPNQT
jgi:hypothetical protein